MDEADEFEVPADLLFAVSQRQGQISMVLGAGCSLEAPTSLKLSWEYAAQVHAGLIADGVLGDGDCSDPEDLSEVAEAVHARTGSQSAVVQRLPVGQFRLARANTGYLLAAALMLEGAVSCITTLNYDLALTDALRQLGAEEVGVVAGPTHLRDFGSRAVIYLHRNVDEADPERWILRREALESEWEDSWEELVAGRISASPVLLFAGLGSPAKVLTSSVERVRQIVDTLPEVYLVDPKEDTPFAEELSVPPGNLVCARWNEFMQRLAARLVDASSEALRVQASGIAVARGWESESTRLEDLLAAIESVGLLCLGKIRARWRGIERGYAPETAESGASLAHLLALSGQLLKDGDLQLRMTLDGLIEVKTGSGLVRHTMGLHGGGVATWAAAEEMYRRVLVDVDPQPDLIIAAGFTGSKLEDLAPPTDIVSGNDEDDIVWSSMGPRLVDAEKELDDGRTFGELVA